MRREIDKRGGGKRHKTVDYGKRIKIENKVLEDKGILNLYYKKEMLINYNE